MIRSALFYGLPVDPSLSSHLSKLNPILLSSFIQKEKNDQGLQDIVIGDKRYIGKFLDIPFELEGLDQMEMHILSLLKRVTPDYQLEKTLSIIACSPKN